MNTETTKKLARITNQQAQAYVARREPFQASNLYGAKESGGYIVRSYDQIIWVHTSDDVWYRLTEKISRTTSRHINQCCPSPRWKDCDIVGINSFA